MRLESWKYEELNREAVNLIEDYGVTYPIDVFGLAERMGIVLMPYSSVSRAKLLTPYDISKDAFTISLKRYEVDSTFICFNQNANPNRLRQSIVHEISHIWLEHPSDDEPFETEAEYLAAYLLAPIPIIIKKQLFDIYSIQRTFGISREAAKIALERSKNRCRCHKPGFGYEYKLIEICTA